MLNDTNIIWLEIVLDTNVDQYKYKCNKLNIQPLQ
jgi:hypothetical protein